MSRQWSAYYSFDSLTTSQLLNSFASFCTTYEARDNMFYSEFSEFLQATLPSIELSPRHFSLFHILTHNESVRIDRFELLFMLLLFCKDVEAPSNCETIFNVLLFPSSSYSEGITSFDPFSRAVLTLIHLMLPQLLRYFQQDDQKLVDSINSQLFASCSGGEKVSVISKKLFMENAPKSFRIDELIRYGRALLNQRVERIQLTLGMASINVESLSAVLNHVCEKDSLSQQEFIDVRPIDASDS